MVQKTIVVVGLSAAGIQVVNNIKDKVDADTRIIAIDALPFAFWPVGSLRASIVPGWEDKVFASFEKVFAPKSRHILVAGTAVVEITANSVILDKEHEKLGKEISFDKLVVSTGSSQEFPCRPKRDATMESMKAMLVQTQKEVKSAESILVIGGGAVGVEFVGEVVGQHPGKKVTLVHNSDQLIDKLPTHKKLSDGLLKLMKDKEVNVILDDKVDVSDYVTGALKRKSFKTEKGQEIEADYIFLATGNKTNTQLIANLYPQEIDEKTKRVKVTDYLNLESNPDIFTTGDIQDLTRYDVGQFTGATSAASATVAKNILSSDGKNLTKYSPPPVAAIIVSFGHCSGMGVLGGFNVGPYFAAIIKSRSLFISLFQAYYAPPKKWFFF